MKNDIIKKIIANKLFSVASSTDESDWILLKNGSRAPMFLDTSKFISFPGLLEDINKLIIQIIKEKNITFDKIIGLPYGGLPFSYGVTAILKVPGLTIRKEGAKNYSTAGELLGIYQKGEKVLIIEDATVTANTVIEFIGKLKAKGLVVSDVITVLDIGKDAKANVAALGVNLNPVFTWRELYESYKAESSQSISQELETIFNNIVGIQ